jgi:hypothetical protein
MARNVTENVMAPQLIYSQDIISHLSIIIHSSTATATRVPRSLLVLQLSSPARRYVLEGYPAPLVELNLHNLPAAGYQDTRTIPQCECAALPRP